ncbi:protein sorting-associated protein 52 [Seminavis robusta]|uniref:Protein sorting-associated protein 52 n=1 Tax=Seminavis robusta TaxID=568900 RepID=A0A9N8DV87_9STRA|nr:protein sorting-associated protein 52 [Seminavis robusta]|eukprot:Sro301_g111950.1 protein sorting-associated protein 52 (103) ;mRNA; r:41481-41789
MIKVVHQYCCMSRHRTIHFLDGFYEKINQLLWPRLKMIVDAHQRSIKSANALKLGEVDSQAHYVSPRFAEFAGSVLLMLKHGNNSASEAAAGWPLDIEPTED